VKRWLEDLWDDWVAPFVVIFLCALVGLIAVVMVIKGIKFVWYW
jgi:hypothetical protein